MQRIYKFILLCCLVAIAGCGGGNDGSGGLNGAVTVVGTQTASNFSSDVTFRITYTNPLRSDMIGVPINFTVYVDGTIIDHQATNFNNSGILTVTYNIGKDVTERVVRCIANSANLVGSDSLTIAAFGTLNVTPPVQTFTDSELAGSIKTYNISGGSGSYIASSNNPDLVSVIVSGTSVIATRGSDNTAAGTVVITVTDTVTGVSVQVQAIVVAAPPG